MPQAPVNLSTHIKAIDLVASTFSLIEIWRRSGGRIYRMYRVRSRNVEKKKGSRLVPEKGNSTLSFAHLIAKIFHEINKRYLQSVSIA